MLKPMTTDVDALRTLDDRLRWLSAWTIHHANHIRESDDGLKVGGHQASCASMTAIMAALYFHAVDPNERVAQRNSADSVVITSEINVGV
jgi:pyruvate dehydrogenase E1 component